MFRISNKLAQLIVLSSFLITFIRTFCKEEPLFVTNYLVHNNRISPNPPIAEGGFGKVYKIEWKGLNLKAGARPAVVKLIHSDNEKAELDREAQLTDSAFERDGDNYVPEVFGCFIDSKQQ